MRFFLREQHGSWGPNHDTPIITLAHDETKPILNLPSGTVTIVIHNLFIDKYDFIANHYHPEGVPRFYKNEQVQVDVCQDNSNEPIIIR